MEKPAPVSVAELMVAAAVPVDDRVIDWLAGVLTATLPKLRLEELIASVATAGFNCSVKLGSEVPAVAERVTACAVVTEATLAEKLALVAPAGMVTEAGTVTEELLLARLTL